MSAALGVGRVRRWAESGRRRPEAIRSSWHGLLRPGFRFDGIRDDSSRTVTEVAECVGGGGWIGVQLAQRGGPWAFGARTPGGRDFPDPRVLGPLQFSSVLLGSKATFQVSRRVDSRNQSPIRGALGGRPKDPLIAYGRPPEKWRKAQLARAHGPLARPPHPGTQ